MSEAIESLTQQIHSGTNQVTSERVIKSFTQLIHSVTEKWASHWIIHSTISFKNTGYIRKLKNAAFGGCIRHQVMSESNISLIHGSLKRVEGGGGASRQAWTQVTFKAWNNMKWATIKHRLICMHVCSLKIGILIQTHAILFLNDDFTICQVNLWNHITSKYLKPLSRSRWSRESSAHHALCLKQLHKQSTYTVDYISVLQTLNNNESIGMKVFNPDIDSDVAAATIKMSSLIHLWN